MLFSIDINECLETRQNLCPVRSQCENTQGSYKCNCDEGFEPIPNRNGDLRCQDIDECTQTNGEGEALHNCHPMATCFDRPVGSFTCVCNMKQYFEGDGVSCKGTIYVFVVTITRCRIQYTSQLPSLLPELVKYIKQIIAVHNQIVHGYYSCYLFAEILLFSAEVHGRRIGLCTLSTSAPFVRKAVFYLPRSWHHIFKTPNPPLFNVMRLSNNGRLVCS